MTKKPKMPMHPQRRNFLQHKAERELIKQVKRADKLAGQKSAQPQEDGVSQDD